MREFDFVIEILNRELNECRKDNETEAKNEWHIFELEQAIEILKHF